MIPIDTFGRAIDYLRVAVTDRCNLRCVYCMPSEGIAPKPRSEILRSEQIVAMVRVAASMGIGRIRLTGGEPLVRRGIVQLAEALAALPGVKEVALTTNGVLLGTNARELARAGVARVNVSLDTLRPERYRRITRCGDLEQVWRGISAAEDAGLAPLKVNVVVVRGVNDDELPDFARLTVTRGWHVRFIEVMPLSDGADWGAGMPAPDARCIPAAEMRERIEMRLGPLVPDAGPSGNGPARYFRLPGARGTVGFISPISEHFCGHCNRLRLTADGWLRTCLFSEQGVFVKPALDADAGDGELAGLIRQAVLAKQESRPLVVHSSVAGQAMSRIGG